uniref:PiggyBac transposable element-derived protein 4 n=1 Tax=Lygus hesperus TaxID=30085 RepID=A0A0A9XSV2_LYGHE
MLLIMNFPFLVVEPPQTPTMGSKRGRLLMRQHRIKKESEAAGDAEGCYETYRIERQHSEPTPNLLSVPSQHSYLIKQNSSPHLTTPSTSSSVGPPSPATGHAPSTPTLENTPITYGKLRAEDLRKLEDFRRTFASAGSTIHPKTPVEEPVRHATIVMSTSQPSCPAISTISEKEPCTEGRSCHCPVLRSGPALGCNYCWNTIDNHGRILRRKTKYHCPECQTNLCIVPCFQAYHERHSANNNPPSNTKDGQPSSGIPTIMKTTSL